MSILFGRNIKLELAELSSTSAIPDTTDACATKCMHFSIKTQLGWIPWKEREAALYSLFERSFGGNAIITFSCPL
jgi:hypothetical protein